jgi:hypothetical protein
LLLLVLENNQPAYFAGAVPLTNFGFHHRHNFKDDDLIDLLHNFQLLQQTFLGSDEIMDDNRCFNDFKKCTNWQTNTPT